MEHVAIFGLGLIGGSLGLALRGRGVRVTGIDRGEIIEKVEVRGVADALVDTADDLAVRRVYREADLAVLAAPIFVILSELGRALESARVVTDAGSTKREIARAGGGASHFVPGHPLAGASESGAAHARGDLFQARRWILCADGAAPAAVERAEEFVSLVGAEVAFLSPEAHDRAVAATSHVPQLLASALVVLCERRQSRVASGPGFTSTTRIAGGNPQIWGDILATNADCIAEVLGELSEELASIGQSLDVGDPDSALAVIEAARLAGVASRSR